MEAPMYTKINDEESGSCLEENSEFMWAFIWKVFGIISIQFLLTVVIAYEVATLYSFIHFLSSGWAGYAVDGVIFLITSLFLIPLDIFKRNRHVNYLLLGIFTVALAFPVGLNYTGKTSLEAAILITAVVINITIYAFFAAWRGHDFSYKIPFLTGALIILIVSTMIQIFHPLGNIWTMLSGVLIAILFCLKMFLAVDRLIRELTYDEYILSAILLNLDIFSTRICGAARREDLE